MQTQAPPPAPPAPQPRQPREIPWGLITIAAVVLVLVFVPGWLTGLLPGIPNPFEEETVDRSGPAVLKSIRGLEELHSATGHFEVVVDLEKDTALPAPVLGERTLFVADADEERPLAEDRGRQGRVLLEVDDDLEVTGG